MFQPGEAESIRSGADGSKLTDGHARREQGAEDSVRHLEWPGVGELVRTNASEQVSPGVDRLRRISK